MFGTLKVKLAAAAALLLSLAAPCFAEAPQMSIADTVIQVPLADGVTMDDAVASMKLRANALNFKLVAHLPLYKELQSMGVDSQRIEIFQFCDARIAKAMIDFDPNFAAYLPCRITLMEDAEGHPLLVTMKLDLYINSANLPPELHAQAVKVRDAIASIMQAGAEGDL